jgi:signal transduction histidine kinase
MRIMAVSALAATAEPDDQRLPKALADRGLAAALGNLLETVQRPTTLKAADLPRLPARVEACVYSCLAALLHGWPRGETRVLISVSARDGRLGVVLFDPEATDFAHIATAAGWQVVVNRVAALGGTLASSPNFGGLIITLDVPATRR